MLDPCSDLSWLQIRHPGEDENVEAGYARRWLIAWETSEVIRIVKNRGVRTSS